MVSSDDEADEEAPERPAVTADPAETEPETEGDDERERDREEPVPADD